jgi:phosphate transport system protein
MDDEMMDDLNDQIFRELLTYMMGDARTIHRALIISHVSKSLERMADHAVGIADMVVYMVTGKSVRHGPPCEAEENTQQ